LPIDEVNAQSRNEIAQYYDTLDTTSVREVMMFVLFGFFAQQIVRYIQRTYAYIEQINNDYRQA
jgi:hypothetical protein